MNALKTGIVRYFQFWSGLIFLAYHLFRQGIYKKKIIRIIEKKFQSPENDGTLSKALLAKIKYYSSFMPVMVGDIYCLMRGYPMSAKELEMQTYLSIFTPIFDEWFDNPAFTSDPLYKIIFQHDPFIPRNSFESLTADILLTLHRLAPESERWTDMAQKLIESQTIGLKQTDAQFSLKDIRHVTFDKAGYALLLTRFFLEHPLSIEEEKAIMQFGCMIQYFDDIFDIREDYLAGIRTLATESTDINALTADYTTELDKTFRLFEETTYEKHAQKRFKYTICLLFSMPYIALYQLQKAQKKRGGSFDISLLTRAELVCDMAKVRNWGLWFWFYITK